ncbi:MAG: DUF3857 domain-containing protein [Bacteroidia bacterium]|nr:MAG: DUF3857 domain-containing protein [Bacteroidia bacterium]
MKTVFFTLLFVFSLYSNVIGSTPPFEFGRASQEEMDVEYFRNKYPDEPAVIIGDIADCKFNFNNESRRFQFVFERHMRLMILREEGLSYGDFSIPFYESESGKENIRRFRAYVHNLDGDRVRTTRIRPREGFENDLGNNWKELVFAFPNVRVGSIIEVRYELNSDFLFNMRSWRFQHQIPILHSEYNVNMPSFFNYLARFKGFFDLDVNEQRSSLQTFRYERQVSIGYGSQTGTGGQTYNISAYSTHFKWIARKLDGMKREPYTDNINNYLGTMFFELISEEFPDQPPVHYTTSWEYAANYILNHKDFGEYLQNAAAVTRALALENDNNDKRKKVEWALKTIHEKIRWNRNASFLAGNTPDRVLADGSGNSAEINLLLVSLLRSLGLEAYPVAASTVRNGALFSDAPTLSQWNYVIAQVRLPGEEPLLLDATTVFPYAGYLPQRIINGRGRVFDRQVNEWVNLENNISYNLHKAYEMELDSNGNLNGTLVYTWKDFGAYSILQEMSTADNDHLLDEFTNETGARINDIIVEPAIADNDTLMVTLTANFRIPAYAQVLGDEIIMPGLLFETRRDNPFTLEERLYPVVFPYNATYSYSFFLKLPENASIDYLPRQKTARWGRFSHQFNFLEEEGGISITGVIENLTRTVNANQYRNFRNYMNRLAENNSDHIIISLQ